MEMAYSVDFREIVLKYIDEGNSLRKARENLKMNLKYRFWKILKK